MDKLIKKFSPIATILCEPDYKLYWKKTLLINSIEIIKFFQDKILPGEEFAETAIKEINEGLEFSGLQSYEVRIFNKVVQDIYLPFLVKAMKRTLNNIINIIYYIFSVEICYGQSTIEQKELIVNLKKCLNQKFKIEEEVSDEIANIAHIVSEKFNNKNINISNLHSIFQNLIHIQTGKSKETRYYHISGTTAYNAMKMIMRLLSVLTLKSYINECEQNSGWQDKIASQLLSNLSINNIWRYGRMDFENEMDEYQEFAIQKLNQQQ
ncbi:hypothetical protein Glove_177g88 [Diversispora epigaea]|uniref:Uncharacterized protein n=1 Tax=Diversispora epigaea TaxID=1348612 RepID=A0A397IR68_9GLOM|nr:hypothetical protein Glove_177g88 [Diversispora epigaea]